MGAAISSLILPRSVKSQASEPIKTEWKVRSSEGFDALAFLGPLTGSQQFQKDYGSEVAAFRPLLPEAIRTDIATLWRDWSRRGFGILGPNLALLFSSGSNDASIDTLLEALEQRSTRLLPEYRASRYWRPEEWHWFDREAPRLSAVLEAMRAGGFSQFRAQQVGSTLDRRIREIQSGVTSFDVIRWQEKLTGRSFDRTIEVILLAFSKPFGSKVQGQRFLQSIDYDVPTTVRVAAHEMLHPPMPLDGAAARSALAALAADPLMTRIVREHDPQWGYTTLEGLFDEDLCEALDQLISEALGVARNPADRWRRTDGFHVLAAGFYGLLRQDRWSERGGSIEEWLAGAVRHGRLDPSNWHPIAARILERPTDALWPLQLQ